MKVLIALVVLISILALPDAVYANRPVGPILLQPEFGTGAFDNEPVEMTPEEIARREMCLRDQWEMRRQNFQLPVGDLGTPEDVSRSPQSWIRSGPQIPLAPGDFTIYRNTLLNDTFTQDQTSSTNEPTLGMNCETVFYAGNWYATVSADGGRTFTYVDPSTFFPAYSGGFCCDQVVYYEPSRNIMIWYLQYSRDADGNNTIVIAISTSNDITEDSPNNNFWHWYAITPQDFGYGDGVWFDFPELSVSSNFLYWTTDIIGAGDDNALALKFSLDDLADANPITGTGILSEQQFLRPTHGATTTMYIGEHLDTSTMRIHVWPEGDATPTSVDRGVDTWFTGTYSAPSPDGTDWLAYGIPGLLAAWVSDGIVGFMWDSVQGGGFPWPNVRFVRFVEAGLGVFDQGQIWNPETAFAYPSVHPNSSGNIAGTMAFGGGGLTWPYPSFLAWIADEFNANTIAPLENLTIAEGDAGPASDRWGDFLTCRRNVPFGETWVGTGFVLTGGQNADDTDPYFIWFGREEDTPDPPSITCPDDVIVECTGAGGVPRDDAQLTDFFNGVSASHPCDDDLTITDDAPGFFPLGETVVIFTVEDNLGFSNECTALVTVVDTTPPDITCPDDITVECSAHGGTPREDPQLDDFWAAVSASDICCEVMTADDGPDFFDLGETVVTFTATDCEGNESTCTAVVTVEDTIPPEIAVELNRYVLWPPNHKMSDITATVTVEDICCADPTFVLTSIVSNEPDDGLGDGDTENDIQDAEYGTPDVEFRLRAERAGGGDGRIYTILYTASDCVGNMTENVVEVHVPHDQSGGLIAGVGLTEDETDLLPGIEQYSLVIPAIPEFDPSGVDPDRAYVGNHIAAIPPISHVLHDVNHDGLLDLELTYEAAATLELRERSGPDPVGMHYTHIDGTNYWVEDIFDLGMSVTAVPEPLDAAVTLFRAIPNPLLKTTQMAYAVSGDGRALVTITVYNVAGQRVRELVNAYQDPGIYRVTWNGRNEAGIPVRSGVYFMRTLIGDVERMVRVTIAR